MKRRWIRIEVPCSPALADDMAAEIAEAFEVGIEILDTGVCFYLEEEHFLADGQDNLVRVLRNFGETQRLEGLPAYSFSSIPDEDWMEQWKVNFKPLRVGKHLVVAPTWEEVARILRIGSSGLTREWLLERAIMKRPGCAWSGLKSGLVVSRNGRQHHCSMSGPVPESWPLPARCWDSDESWRWTTIRKRLR